MAIKTALNSINILTGSTVNHFHLCKYQENVTRTNLGLLKAFLHPYGIKIDYIRRVFSSQMIPAFIGIICIKKILCDCLKRAEEVYCLNILNDRKNSAKNLWKHFGPILNNSKKRRGDISSPLVNGVKITEDKVVADTFNDFFSNVGRNLDQKIGSVDKNLKNTWVIGRIVPFSLLQY